MFPIRLGASSAPQWINCPDSVEKVPAWKTYSLPSDDTNKKEGDKCHEYVAGILAEHGANVPMDNLPPSGLPEDFQATCMDYLGYVTNLNHQYNEHEILLEGTEKPICIITPHATIAGRADYILATTTELHIVDLKTSKGRKVTAEANPQLMIYAWGVLEKVWKDHNNYNPKITLHIFQPDNTNTATLTCDELYGWIQHVLLPAVKNVYELAGQPKERHGGVWCVECKKSKECPMRAYWILGEMQKSINVNDKKFSWESMEAIVEMSSDYNGMLSAIKKDMIHQIETGKQCSDKYSVEQVAHDYPIVNREAYINILKMNGLTMNEIMKPETVKAVSKKVPKETIDYMFDTGIIKTNYSKCLKLK